MDMGGVKRNVIVMVDDDEEYVGLFKAKLKRWGADYEVITNATKGSVPLESFGEFASEVVGIVTKYRERCAAIFLDLELNQADEKPWMTGFSLGKTLRKEFYELPILILTQHGEKEAIREGYMYDFDSYLEKAKVAIIGSEEFHGYLLRSMQKRSAMVDNLPQYYANHVKLGKTPITVLQAFGSTFVTEGSSHLETTLDSALEWEQYLSRTSRTTVLLFADLVNSTRIKEESGMFEGLRITRLHNKIMTNCIQQSGGIVVKYIGDCVMARYDYESAGQVNCDSINAAIKMQEALSDHNSACDLRQPIETKIGLAAGPVADFYGGDPQGRSVDLAARVQSIAKPGQIVVSRELLDLVKAGEIRSKIGIAKNFRPKEYICPTARKKLKGFRELIEVCEINWDGQNRGIDLDPIPAS